MRFDDDAATPGTAPQQHGLPGKTPGQAEHSSLQPRTLAPDLLSLDRHLAPAERERLDSIRQYLQHHIRSQSIEFWNREEFPQQMLPGLADLGLGELHLSDASALLKGLIHLEVARADLSLSALLGIHNELIIGTIDALGSTEQKDQWLPWLRDFSALGAFCMTEPDHGSDIAGGMETTASSTSSGTGWVIRGAKRWIGMATLADLALVWARDTADNQVKCFLVPTDTPGFHAQKIHHKTGLRIMQNADVIFDDVELPAEALLPGATSFAAAAELLRASRAWVGWQAVGAQQALLDIGCDYARRREQFGVPIASHQLVQRGLALIAGNLSVCAALLLETVSHQSAGTLDMTLASLTKATTTRLARESAVEAREILGGNGLISDYEAAKIAGDIEAIYTYEGTHSINMLIVGRGLTGFSAFT